MFLWRNKKNINNFWLKLFGAMHISIGKRETVRFYMLFLIYLANRNVCNIFGMDMWNAPMVQTRQLLTYRLIESVCLGGPR